MNYDIVRARHMGLLSTITNSNLHKCLHTFVHTSTYVIRSGLNLACTPHHISETPSAAT